jgi:hypothetical protein
MIPEAQLGLSLRPIDLTTHWRRCGLLSDTVAGFIAYAYCHGSLDEAPAHITGISTIFQELLENAAKYSRKRESDIRVRLCHFAGTVLLEIQNAATRTMAAGFERHVERLLATDDLDNMFLEALEASQKNEIQSGIGLLLLLKDYDVKIGVRFESDARGTQITIRAVYFLRAI